jgi:hypothetical protein
VASVAIARMAAPEGTVVSGASGRTGFATTGHQPHRRQAPLRDMERLHSGIAGLQGRLILQAGGALRAIREKPFPAPQAIPRWQPRSSDSMGNGGTHEAWQAASNRLILLCNQAYDDFQSSSYGCLTVTYFHPSLSSSLAVLEGQTQKYQQLSRTVPECPPIVPIRGTYRAA